MNVGRALEILRECNSFTDFQDGHPGAANFLLRHLKNRTKLFTSHNRFSGPYAEERVAELEARNAQIVEQYVDEGMTQAEIGLYHDLHQVTICQILRKAGITGLWNGYHRRVETAA